MSFARRSISLLLVIIFLSNGLIYAESVSCLAPAAAQRWSDLQTVGPQGESSWPDYSESSEITAPKAAFPALFAEDTLTDFRERYGDFGTIVGFLDEGEFNYKVSKQDEAKLSLITTDNFQQLVGRLNSLLPALTAFPDGTTIKLTTSSHYPLLYNKNDNILEIHALLLADKADGSSFVSDDTLFFVAQHDERHLLLKKNLPVREELLNIYIDLLILSMMEEEEIEEIISDLQKIEGPRGYWHILRQYSRIFSSAVEQEKFLRDIIQHILNYHPVFYDPALPPNGVEMAEDILRNLSNDLHSPDKVLHVFYQLAKQLEPKMFTRIQKAQSVYPAEVFPLFAQVLINYPDMFLNWEQTESQILTAIREAEKPLGIKDLSSMLNIKKKRIEIIVEQLWSEGKIDLVYTSSKNVRYLSREQVHSLGKKLGQGYDKKKGKSVYCLPQTGKTKQWFDNRYQYNKYLFDMSRDCIKDAYRERQAKEFAEQTTHLHPHDRTEKILAWRKQLEQELGLITSCYQIALEDFNSSGKPRLPGTDEASLQYALETAISMAGLGGDLWGICAAILSKTDKKKVRVELRKKKLSKSQIDMILGICRQAEILSGIPFLPPTGDKRAIQNHFNLLIQRSRLNPQDSHVNPNILMLTILGKVTNLRGYLNNPTAYRYLSAEEKRHLAVETQLIYAPLADFLVLGKVAAEIREVYFRVSEEGREDGINRYEELRKLVPAALDFRDLDYIALQTKMNEIQYQLQKALAKRGLDFIKVQARVKSLYSVWDKRETKSDRYPTVASMNDLFGIRLIAPTESLYRKHQGEIRSILREVFPHIYQDQFDPKTPAIENWEHKSVESHGYEGYDFVGLTAERCKVEVQVFISQKDFRDYLIGRAAHWLHRLTSKSGTIKRLGFGEQEFDADILERIQGKITDDFSNNIAVYDREIRDWIFAGVLVNGEESSSFTKIHTVRLPVGATDIDLVSSGGVDQLSIGFQGLVDVTEELILAKGCLLPTRKRQRAPGVYPAIFKVAGRKKLFSKLKPVEIAAWRKRRNNVKRLRSYLQISRFLSELAAPKKKKKPKKGRKKKPAKKTKSVKQDPKAERQEETQNMLRAALSKFLQPLGLQLDSKGVYFKYLHIHLTLIARRIGLRDFSELMELIYFVIQPDEGRWFGQLYQQCQEVLTGVKEEVYIDDREIIARLASLGFDKPKENPRLLLLAHLFTSTQRGESIFYKVVEELQANERYDINLSEEDIIQRVELMLPAYDVLDRGQLFARIGLNEEIMDTIQLRLTAGDLPTVHFSTTRQTSGVWNAIFGIMEEEELELIDFDDGLRDAGDKSDKDILCLLSFVPPRNFIRSTIRRFLAAIAETKHVIKNSVVLSGGGREDILITAKVIAARNRVKILQIITDLFKKENLDCGLDISTVGSVAEIVVKRAPEDMNLNLLEDILKNNLETERLSYAELTVEKYDRSGAGRQKITPPTAVASSV